jgi:anthranilate/para-aminobenzoate synthase component I/anthranilate/para-aminobenzoate synthase component II
MLEQKSQILFIDAYDSFSNNIISLLETALDAQVRTVKIDNVLLTSDDNFRNELKFYTAVVCGPGPGHPVKHTDVGIIRHIWDLCEEDLVPVLGICLGFQSLCLAFGGIVGKLRGPQHGMVRKVTHVGDAAEGEGSIFDGVGEIHATLYQSLVADIGHHGMSDDTFQKEKWNATEKCPDLIPLAWAEWYLNEENESGIRDEWVLLAVRHKTKPFWALQYHPESVCTNGESHGVIVNWFEGAKKWNDTARKEKIKPLPHREFMDQVIGKEVVRKSLLNESKELSFLRSLGTLPASYEDEHANEILNQHLDEIYRCHTVKLPEAMLAPDILEVMQDTRRDQIILDSSNSHESSAQVRGRYSIIALDVEDCLRFDYVAGRNSLGRQYFKAGFVPSVGGYKYASLDSKSSSGIWPLLAQFLEKRRISDGNLDSPFWGGFMGFTSYEMGLEGIDVKPKSKKGLDLCLVWVTRSLVLDHIKGLIYIQDVSKESSDGSMPQWIKEAASKLTGFLRPEPFPAIAEDLSKFVRENSEGNGNTTPSALSNIQSSASKDSLPSSGSKSAMLTLQPLLTPAEFSRLSLPPHPMYTGRPRRDNGSSSRSSSSQPQASTSTDSQRSSSSRSSLESNPEPTPKRNFVTTIMGPTAKEYESKVRRCQEYIREGDSYELCLTDQTTVQRHRFDEIRDDKIARHLNDDPRPMLHTSLGSTYTDGDAWSLYRTLRATQPAPFASFIRLGELTLISSSPERFLKWSAEGHCELRPMKGTVRKSNSVLTLEQAKALLDVPKEKAENLMIVDLVRHDLHGICGSGNVTVPRLMVVEEYKSVFQMITVVEGHIPPPPGTFHEGVWTYDTAHRHTGLDVLAASLPPGSMTGAPKKRSCEILQEIEDKPRGLYSGVVGYMDIGGRGDWSVTIRSMFRWDDEDVREGDGKEGFVETWHVGAGGAVTTLSTPEGEREEMLTKLNGTLGVFR